VKRLAAQARISLWSVNGSSSARSWSLAVTRVALSVIMAVVWAFTAVSRAIFSGRNASICPSAVFGTAMIEPPRT
jgi:hypothetical protein